MKTITTTIQAFRINCAEEAYLFAITIDNEEYYCAVMLLDGKFYHFYNCNKPASMENKQSVDLESIDEETVQVVYRHAGNIFKQHLTGED